MTRHCQLSLSNNLISRSSGLWQAAHSRCSDRPASHRQPQSATCTCPVRACVQPHPCPSHLLGSPRPGRGPAHRSAQLSIPVYLQGQLRHLRIEAGAVSWWTDKRANTCRSSSLLPQAPELVAMPQAPIGPKQLNLPSTFWPILGQSTAESLQARQAKWIASMQASSPQLRPTSLISSVDDTLADPDNVFRAVNRVRNNFSNKAAAASASAAFAEGSCGRHC